MPANITFVLPHLFEFYNQSSADTLVDEIAQRFSKSKKTSVVPIDAWLQQQFQLHKNLEHFSNSARLMALGSGINVQDFNAKICLRADPVMLTATHNGILCRGNRVLNLTTQERESLELLINEYLDEQLMQFKWLDENSGCLLVAQQCLSRFTTLNDVIGQDISQRLAVGEDEKKWHSLMNDLQMVLHNCDVNMKRAELGEPQLTGFWIWGDTTFDEQLLNQKDSNSIAKSSDTPQLYTDSLPLKAIIPDVIFLEQLNDEFSLECLKHSDHSKHNVCIYVSEFADVFYQNDVDCYKSLCDKWLGHWLKPALNKLSKGKLHSISLITADGYQYTLGAHSGYCFWRNHQLVSKKVEDRK